MSKSRIFLFLLLAFIAGVALRSFVSVPMAFLWFGVAAGAVVAAAGVYPALSVKTLRSCRGVVRHRSFPRGLVPRGKGGIYRTKQEIIVYGFLLVAFAGGILRFQQVLEAPPDLSRLYGQHLEVRGLVVEEPEVTPKVQRLTIRAEQVGTRKLEQSFLTLVTLGRYPRYKLGDELLVRGTIQEPEDFSEDFDYRAYLARDDIYSTFFFPRIEKAGEDKGSKLKLVLSKIKYAFEDKIDSALPEPHAAFLKGLTLGERESLPEELVENFNRTGVTHIIALSGYNITLVANFFIWALLALTLPFRFAFWIAAAVIALFVLLTGASPSVVRAGIMGILILVAQREGRLYSIRNALVFAGAVMIFHNPKILRFDAAFQLSFLATLGLVYLSPRVEQWLDRVRYGVLLLRRRTVFEDRRKKPKGHHSLFPINPVRTGASRSADGSITPSSAIFTSTADGSRRRSNGVKRALVETLSAQLMVLPLLIYLFGRVSIVSPLTNLLVILAVPYSMVMGFITAGLGFLWEPLGQIAGWFSWVLLEYMMRVIEFFAAFPLASVELGGWAVMPVLLLYAWISWKWLDHAQ